MPRGQNSKSPLFDRSATARKERMLPDPLLSCSVKEPKGIFNYYKREDKKIRVLEDQIRRIKEQGEEELMAAYKEDLVQLATNALIEDKGLKEIECSIKWFVDDRWSYDPSDGPGGTFSVNLQLNGEYVYSSNQEENPVYKAFSKMIRELEYSHNTRLFEGEFKITRSALGVSGVFPDGEEFTL